MTEFQTAVAKIVRMIPYGQVASYGQVAAYIGSPRAARQVGWTMRALGDIPDFPWWRVINNSGRITIKNGEPNPKEIQATLLRDEGVVVSEDLRIDMKQYRYHPPDQAVGGYKLGSVHMDRGIFD